MAPVEYLPSPCFVQPLSTRSEVTAGLLTRRMNGCQAWRALPDNLSQGPGRAVRRENKSAAPRGHSAARAAAASRTLLDLERLASMVGLPLPPPEPDVVEPQRPNLDLDSEPVKSALRVRLLGTLLSGVKEWSFASIQDVVTQKATTYMVGMDLQGATVLDIERARVIVLNNGRREFINGEAGSGEAVAYT